MSADGPSAPDEPRPFWETKTLEDMTDAEWESLCDGCGRCCLNKLEDEETNELIFTSIACNLLDCTSCRCSDYENRSKHVPDCVKLTPEQVRTLDWLPPSCAYVRVRDGRGLAWWHPLISGDPETVHIAGISVRGRVSAKERDLDLDDFELHAVTWPGEG